MILGMDVRFLFKSIFYFEKDYLNIHSLYIFYVKSRFITIVDWFYFNLNIELFGFVFIMYNNYYTCFIRLIFLHLEVIKDFLKLIF